jgi:hypothetical protein
MNDTMKILTDWENAVVSRLLSAQSRPMTQFVHQLKDTSVANEDRSENWVIITFDSRRASPVDPSVNVRLPGYWKEAERAILVDLEILKGKFYRLEYYTVNRAWSLHPLPAPGEMVVEEGKYR